jgi:hypothetical protein
LRLADPPSKESYRLCIDYGTEKGAKAHKGCRAIEEEEKEVLGAKPLEVHEAFIFFSTEPLRA